MNARNVLRFVVSAVLCTLPFWSSAQTEWPVLNDSDRVVVTMEDGSEFRGTVVLQTDSTLTLATVNGELQLLRSRIDEVKIDDYVGEFRFPNPHATRYFFSPSAIPLRSGEGYYQNLELVGNFANVGVTDFFSIGGGFEFLSTVAGYPIFFLTPKLGWQVADKWHVGSGVFMGGGEWWVRHSSTYPMPPLPMEIGRPT